MVKKTKLLFAARKIALAAVTLFALSHCTPEEDLITPVKPETDTPVEETAVPTPPPAEELPTVASLTISGIHTVQSEQADCSTCTYTVPADSHLVDGAQLGIKPGNVICLDKAIAYGMIEFINLEGTVENPITIAYCGK